MMINILALALLLQTCPHHHAADVDARHDTFGMRHDESAHHFRLFGDGGAIELRANDGGDAKTIDAIRSHLKTIVDDFANGDFDTPAFVHGHPPDGVAAMARLRDAIR